MPNTEMFIRMSFTKALLILGLCKDGQKVLDIGTGTGVLPRNMYQYGAKWIGTDISNNQIEQAKLLAAEKGMDIEFYTCPAEEVNYKDNTFDVITVCQCIWYLDARVIAGKFAQMLKPGGKLLILYMGWLPYEDAIAGKSEEIILKHNPNWSSYGDTVHPVFIPDELLINFEIVLQKEYRVMFHLQEKAGTAACAHAEEECNDLNCAPRMGGGSYPDVEGNCSGSIRCEALYFIRRTTGEKIDGNKNIRKDGKECPL